MLKREVALKEQSRLTVTMISTRFRVLAVWVLLIGLIAWWGVNNIWRSPAYYPQNVNSIPLNAHILSRSEYEALAVTHPRPYVVHLESSQGAVLLYGAEHTRDPHDPQIADIQTKWNEFSPSVALVEGRLDFLAEGFMNPVVELGEGGWVNKLARDNGIPSYTWELRREEEVALMLESFLQEQAVLYYVLRPYFSSVRFGKPADPDATLQGYIDERIRTPGLGGVIVSVADVDRIWQRDFAGWPDWRDTSDEYGWPGYLNEVSERANSIRDEHLAKLIIYLVQKGERAFVVAGSSHAVSLDSALREILAP